MRLKQLEAIRFGVNGIAATAVHYGVLSFNLEVLGFSSAGLANLIAAVLGVSFSFLGNRYFVFPQSGESFFTQALKFGGLYGLIAILHGMVLLFWTDWLQLDYRLGFVLATVMQVSHSYIGNRTLVFKS